MTDRSKHLKNRAPQRRVTRPVAPGVKDGFVFVPAEEHSAYLEKLIGAILYSALPSEMIPQVNGDRKSTGFMEISAEATMESSAFVPVIVTKANGNILVGLAPGDEVPAVMETLRRALAAEREKPKTPPPPPEEGGGETLH